MADKRKKRGSIKKLRRPLAYVMLAAVLAITLICVAVYINSNENSAGEGAVAGAALALLTVFAAFGAYLSLCAKDVLSDAKKMLMLCVALLFVELLALLMMHVNPCFSPMLIAVMIFALMLDERIALMGALVMAISSAVIAASNMGYELDAIAVACATAINGVTAVFALRMRRTRSSTIIASAIAGVSAMLAYMGIMLTGGAAFADYWVSLLLVAGSSLLCGIVTVGIMPLFEMLFDAATDARLNELLNNNNPLIKRLMMEAPGTYHHSVLVASLAEAAAEDIGANALLCKVGAYYHDVGKLRSPMYFRENQRNDYNIHDELDPYESAQRIIAHQRDGVTLLSKYRLPSAVTKIVAEHHGDSIVVYFYDKAKRLAPHGAYVDEKQFRYPSQKPSTKEGAIVLLADCCEAAVRSMPNASMTDVETKVREVITHKWDKRDSMLWASPLTFSEISRIERSFVRTFSALHHERVEYPDLAEIDVR